MQSYQLGSPQPCMNGLKACGFQPVQFGSSHGGGNGPIMFAGQFGSSQHGICGIIMFAGQFGSSQQGSPSFPSSIGNGKKPPFPCSYCSRPARSGNCDTSQSNGIQTSKTFYRHALFYRAFLWPFRFLRGTNGRLLNLFTNLYSLVLSLFFIFPSSKSKRYSSRMCSISCDASLKMSL